MGLVSVITRERRKLAARLRELRLDRGLSLAQAAELAGLHDVALGRLERGGVNPTLPTLVALARAYRIRLRELFD